MFNPKQAADLLLHFKELSQEAMHRQPSDHRFNLFRLLRPAHDEVRLHSRFLAELLNPTGTHGQGSIFLYLFANQLQTDGFILPIDFNLNQVTVRREHRRIDLLLDDGKYWFIIENKIYAPDQPSQLLRYYNEAVASHRIPLLHYLTLDGHTPAIHSTEGLPEAVAPQLLSYADSINEWLTHCTNATSNYIKLQQAILQYQQIIWHLIGQTMDNEKDAVLRLVEQADYAVQAAALVRNWQHVRHHVEYQFWLELEKLVARNYRVDGEAHFSRDTIHAAIHRQKNRTTGYGIKFELGILRQKPVLFKLNRGDSPLTYGLPIKSLPAATAEEIAALRIAFQSPQQSFWLACQQAAGPLNFGLFSNEATVQLANPITRSRTIAALWQESASFAQVCTSCIQEIFGSDFIPSTSPASDLS